MPETNNPRDLVATLQDVLHTLAGSLERTRPALDAIASQVARLQEGVAALGDLRQHATIAVEVDMVVDAATDVLAVFRALASGILDTQEDVDTLAATLEEDVDGRKV
jgi:hypothetical protein